MKRFTRRRFLKEGAFGSVILSGINTTQLSKQSLATTENQTTLPADRPELLRLAMNEIIPAGAGMPAAGEIGCVQYVEGLAKQSAKLEKQLQEISTSLEVMSRAAFHVAFGALQQQRRAEALARLEKQSPEMFKNFRDLVYEAYYEQPRVWKLIGYEFYSTNGGGPTPPTFDDEILASVRHKPSFYRGV